MLHTVVTSSGVPPQSSAWQSLDQASALSVLPALPALKDEPFVTAVHPRALVGNLDFVALPLLLRTVAGSGRPATILFPEKAPVKAHSPLTSLRAWGAVALNGDRFLDARFAEHTGTEALLRLLLVPSGEFETWHDLVLWPVHQLAGRDLDTVLAEAAATLNVVRELGADLFDLDMPLGAHPWQRTLTPRSFLLDWPGALREGIDVLVEAVSTGTLERLDAASSVH